MKLAKIAQNRVLLFLLHLACVWVALVLADYVAYHVRIVPMSMSKPSRLDGVTRIFLTFGLLHSAALLLRWRLERAKTESRLTRAWRGMMLGLIATGLGSSERFLATVAPFSPNFYAWVYVIVIALHGSFVAAAAIGDWRDTQPNERLRAAFKAVSSGWTAGALLVTVSLGAMALTYKKNRSFANMVNHARIYFSVDTDERWQLTSAFPGKFFEQPMDLYLPPDRPGELYLLTRPGRLFLYQTTPWQEQLLIDLSEEVASVDLELGAFSFALHPEFGRTPGRSLVFVWYTHTDGKDQYSRLARFDLALPTLEQRMASQTMLIDIKRTPSGMHSGGTLRFGQRGFLFLSIGDYIGRSQQKLDETLCCGIFRIDVDQRGGDMSSPIRRQPAGGTTANYFIPKDNPWYGKPVLEEYWAHGFRNPFRMWVDPKNDDVWLGDVGKDRWEEVNHVKKGDNGQWNYAEGPETGEVSRPSNVIGNELAPFYAYRQTSMLRAVLGGLIYRGALHAELRERYVYADNNGSTVFSLNPDEPGVEPAVLARGSQFGQLGITSIATDSRGEIYFSELGSKEQNTGQILKLVRQGAAPPVQKPREPNMADVRAKFEMVCSRCHGSDGRGALTASAGMHPRPDFTSAEWQDKTSDEQIRRVVLDGGVAVGLNAEMPGWRGFFNEDEMGLLVKHIRHFAKTNN